MTTREDPTPRFLRSPSRPVVLALAPALALRRARSSSRSRAPSRFVALAFALVLALPTVGAAWSTFGSVEPDTPQDARDGFMPLAPDTRPGEAERTIYFNVVEKWAPAGQRGRVNPNLAPESRLAPPTHLQAAAYLGLWKDCNGDGYIGHAGSVAWTYREELLSDSTICPEGGSHHRERWVREFVWIRPHRDTGTGSNEMIGLQEPHVVIDTSAAVWGDFGLPGARPDASCRSLAVERGTLSRTGALLGFADCQANYLATNTLTALDADGSLGLAFESPRDPEDDCDHPLNRPTGVWADPHACEGDRHGLLAYREQPAFTVFDCSAPGTAIRDPTAPENGRGDLSVVPRVAHGAYVVGPIELADEEGRYYVVPAMAPAIGDASRGHVEALHQMGEDLGGGCGYGEWGGWVSLPTRALRSHADVVPRSVESDVDADADGVRRAHDFAFAFGDAATRSLKYRYNLTRSVWTGLGQPDPVRPLLLEQLGAAPEWDAGVLLVGEAMGPVGIGPSTGGYHTVGDARAPPSYLGNVRGTLEARGTIWLTFYARVGAATLQHAPAPANALYGVEACPPGVGGVRDGWDCDAADWWRTDTGASSVPSGAFGATPGTSYQFRDIDCLDGRAFAASPVDATLFGQAGERCPEVST